MISTGTERIDSIEFSQDYHYYLKDFKHIYFCRDCLRNFNTKVRVLQCNKCQGENIVELPPIEPLPQKQKQKSFRLSATSQVIGNLLNKTKFALIFIYYKVSRAFIEIRGKLRVFFSNTRRTRNFASRNSYNIILKSKGWSHKEELPTDVSY